MLGAPWDGYISTLYSHERCMNGKMSLSCSNVGIPGGHNLIEESISSTVLNQIKMWCYLVLFHVFVRVQRTGSRPCNVTACVSVDAVAWGPLAHALRMWRHCQVDNLTSPSASPSLAYGIGPGPTDDLVRPDVPGAFLAGRAECSPTLRFSDDQNRVGYRENTISINTSIHET